VVVARVWEVEIMLSEVMTAIYSMPPEERGKHHPEVLYERTLDRLVEGALVYHAALEAGLADDPRLQRRLRLIERQVLSDAYLQTSLAGRVDDAFLSERYDAYVAGAAQRKQYHARHIRTADEAAAIAVKARIDAGESFEDVARSLNYTGATRGGDLGFFDDSNMVPEIVEVAARMAVGSVSEPFESQYGWHLLSLEAVRPAPVASLDEMREQLTNDAWQDLRAAEVEALRLAAPISRFGRQGEQAAE
jgi:peptidyl-prolyl cis-trans isomerase C